MSPWGKILAGAETEETILLHEIDLKEIDSCRERLMYSKQRRTDIYELEAKAAIMDGV